MSKLLNLALAAAFGLAVSAPLYAADSQNKSAALSDSEARAAMDKCNNLTATAKAKCIVNIRPTAAATGDKNAAATGSDAEANVVKDGNARAEEEYSAAAKQCESVNASDRDRCITTAKEKFGRM